MTHIHFIFLGLLLYSNVSVAERNAVDCDARIVKKLVRLFEQNEMGTLAAETETKFVEVAQRFSDPERVLDSLKDKTMAAIQNGQVVQVFIHEANVNIDVDNLSAEVDKTVEQMELSSSTNLKYEVLQQVLGFNNSPKIMRKRPAIRRR